MNSELLFFVECGQRMSKHADSHNSDRWDISEFRFNINPVAVVSEDYTKILHYINI